jgi:hypothetical protein
MFKEISKEAAKVLKALIAAASTDTMRTILQQVHITDKHMCAANGFMATFVKNTDLMQDENGQYTKAAPGTYKFELGKLGKQNILRTTDWNDAGTTYPDLQTILHTADEKPTVRVGVNAGLLRTLLAAAGETVVISIYTDEKSKLAVTTPIELQYSIGGVPAYSVLMPMHVSADANEQWKPVKVSASAKEQA